MNVKSVLDLLMGRLGRRQAVQLRQDALKEMTLIQEQLEQAPELPWFLESEEVTTQTEAGEARVPVPPDFLREKEDFNLKIVLDDGTEQDILRRNYDEAEVEISVNSEPGIPQIYYRVGDYLVLRPAPDAVYTIKFPTYYARQEPPSDSTASENEWFQNVPDLLMAMTGVVMAGQYLQNPILTETFVGLQARAENRLVRLMTAREEENRNRRMG